MRYRKLGRTGIEVSEIGFGAWALGGPALLGGKPFGYGVIDEKECLRALETALDRGINLIDTADVYGLGHSERLVGQVARRRRDRVVIATKGGSVPDNDEEWWVDTSYHHLMAAAERSLSRLGTDHIDVYQLHSPPEETRWDDVHRAFGDLKRQGKVRATGVSVSLLAQGEELARTGSVDVIQVIYNMLSQDPARELLPRALENGVGIIARVPFAYGLLAGKYSERTAFADDDWRKDWSRNWFEEQLAKVAQLEWVVEPPLSTLAQASLAFVLAEPAVSTVIPGIKHLRHLEDSLRAMDCPPLSADAVVRIRELYRGWRSRPVGGTASAREG
jgi:aryl-alcohol dehydrogenase-like predicted oxidoreductase